MIKKKSDIQEKIDSEKWNKEKNEKIKSQTVKTAQKHLIEKNSLKKKVEIEIEVMKKEKGAGLETLVHKYKNRKFDLELQQKQEKLLNDNANLFKASKLSIFIDLFFILIIETTTNPKFRTKKFVSVYQTSPSKKE